ncbi:glutathione S-transferase [Aspergillus similis]
MTHVMCSSLQQTSPPEPSSKCIVWLCKELGLTYTLKTYNRSPLLALPEFKAIHPQGSAPTIQDSNGDRTITLAESGACVKYICCKHAGGKLLLNPEHPGYVDFLYWFHRSNGTLVPAASGIMITKIAGVDESNQMASFMKMRLNKSLKLLDDRLKDNKWLAGEEFTAADLMVGFLLTTLRYFSPFSLEEFPNIVRYLGRIGKREAYRRAMKKGNPELELVLGANLPEKTLI